LIQDEKLVNAEIGVEYSKEFLALSLNVYRMDFRDELIPMDYRYRDDDNILKGNVPKTVHTGIEIETAYRVNRFVGIRANMSLSKNTFIEFTGDALGWGGYGTLADYSGKRIPGYPSIMMNLITNFSFNQHSLNLEMKYNGKQYIDFANTEESIIPSYTIVNLSFNMPLISGSFGSLTLDGKIFNVFDTLYETFGYNYYTDPETRIDVYWPGGTRNYFLTLTWHFLNN
jgi:outer membrane receptor protein involved in Fe transport